MSAKRSRMILKAALLAPVGPLESWGVQQVLAGDAVAGGVSMVIGVLFVAAFVAFQEHDIPYESEIVDVIEQNPDAFDTESMQSLSKDISEMAARLDENEYDLDAAMSDGKKDDTSNENEDA